VEQNVELDSWIGAYHT